MRGTPVSTGSEATNPSPVAGVIRQRDGLSRRETAGAGETNACPTTPAAGPHQGSIRAPTPTWRHSVPVSSSAPLPGSMPPRQARHLSSAFPDGRAFWRCRAGTTRSPAEQSPRRTTHEPCACPVPTPQAHAAKHSPRICPACAANPRDFVQPFVQPRSRFQRRLQARQYPVDRRPRAQTRPAGPSRASPQLIWLTFLQALFSAPAPPQNGITDRQYCRSWCASRLSFQR